MFNLLDHIFGTSDTFDLPHPTFAIGDLVAHVSDDDEVRIGTVESFFDREDGEPMACIREGKLEVYPAPIWQLRPATDGEELVHWLTITAVPEVGDVVRLENRTAALVLFVGRNPAELLDVPGLYVITLSENANLADPRIGIDYGMDWIDLGSAELVISEAADDFAADVLSMPLRAVHALLGTKTAVTAEALTAVS